MSRTNRLGALAAAVGVLLAVGLLRLILLAVEAEPAEATFPGKNGKIAFQSDGGGSYEIYTMNRNGKKINKLTTNRAPDEDPAFSPNGKRIAFMSDRSGDSDIYKMTVKGRRLVQLTADPATTFGADWAVK